MWRAEASEATRGLHASSSVSPVGHEIVVWFRKGFHMFGSQPLESGIDRYKLRLANRHWHITIKS